MLAVNEAFNQAPLRCDKVIQMYMDFKFRFAKVEPPIYLTTKKFMFLQNFIFYRIFIDLLIEQTLYTDHIDCIITQLNEKYRYIFLARYAILVLFSYVVIFCHSTFGEVRIVH